MEGLDDLPEMAGLMHINGEQDDEVVALSDGAPWTGRALGRSETLFSVTGAVTLAEADELDEPIPEPDGGVASVAEGFVDRRTAAAKGHPVPHLVGRAVCGFYRYPAPDP